MRNYEIGADIQNVEAFDSSEENFLKKAFTDEEISYCFSKSSPPQHLAARFAVKEALIKAFSQFRVNIHYRDIEILIKAKKPLIRMKKRLKEGYSIKVSMSHSGEYALGFALVEKNGKDRKDK